MFITFDQLIEAIQDATVKMEVIQPSTDYYNRAPQEASFEYVCPHRLIESLQSLEDVATDDDNLKGQ